MEKHHAEDKQPSEPHDFIYFAPVDIQIARVDRNCVIKFCEAMACEGAAVTLVSLAVKVLPTEPTATRSIWDVFGVQQHFALVSVRVPLRQVQLDAWFGGLLVKMARTLAYPLVAVRLLTRNARAPLPSILYVKNYGLVPGLRFVSRLLRKKTLLIFEAHLPPRNWLQSWALRNADGVVCNGRAVYRALLENGQIRPDRSMAIHQGFSMSSYPSDSRAKSRNDARARLGWNKSDGIAVYTGKMYWVYDEIELLVQAASQLIGDDIRLVIVGGRADHAQRWRDEVLSRGLTNVIFTGFIAPADIVDYQVAADVLLSYYPSGMELNDYRSPGKLFEYMASGTPIVAADYSSLREVLENRRNALLVSPDKPNMLADAIRHLVGNPALCARLGRAAQMDARQYTWAARAEAFSDFAHGLRQE